MTRQTSRGRAAGLIGLAALLTLLGAVSFSRRMAAQGPFTGIDLAVDRGGTHVKGVDPGSPADLAGVRAGDRVLRIDGFEVRGIFDTSERLAEAEPGRALRLEVGREERILGLQVVPRRESTAPDVFGYLSLVGLAFLASGLFVALRWPTIRGGAPYAALGTVLFAMLVLSHTGRGDRLDWVIFWADLVASALVPPLLVHLSAAVARRSLAIPKAAVAIAYAPAVLLVAAALLLIPGQAALRFLDPPAAIAVLERLNYLFLAAAVGASTLLLSRSYRRSGSGPHRSQVRGILWGLGVGLAPFLAFYAVPWALGANVPAWAGLVSVVPLLLVPMAFTAALVRYRLHDLDLILRRGFAEVVAAFFTLGVYALAVVALRWLGEEGLLPLTRNAARYVGILPAAASYLQLRPWARAMIDRTFFRKRYSYRATLLDWARDLNAEVDLDALLGGLRLRVAETLEIPRTAVFLRTVDGRFEAPAGGSEEGLELAPEILARVEHEPCVVVRDGQLPALPWARYLFGMRVKGTLRALLVLAERARVDEPLSSEDRSLLATLAAHAAAAIESARLVREVRQGAEEVGRLQARQEGILESSGVGLLLADADGRILAWNRALEGIYDLPRREAIGRRISEVFPLHLVRRIEREFDSVPEGGEARIYRHALVNRGGRRLVVDLSISPAGDGARVVTFDDATDRVRLEEQVARQERLAALGMLAAGVAHEINTPLTGISGYTQMLLEDLPAGDPQHATLEKIEEQARRVSTIANSLLNLARPERAAFDDVSLNDAVREVLHLFDPEVRPLGIRVESDLEPGLPPLRGHKGKLQQVLLNLLMNARDAVGEEGRILVATRMGDGRAILEVSDDGAGIAEDDLPRIFDPFFTTKGRGKGTGLGLSISYGIVREHEGEMVVESAPGEGTRFRVELPLIRTARALA